LTQRSVQLHSLKHVTYVSEKRSVFIRYVIPGDVVED